MKMDRMIPMTRGAVALAETMVAVPGAFSVYADGLEARCADVFIKRMNGRGVAVSAGADSSAWIVIKKAALDHPEGYQLQIDADRVTIHAATERGAGWALTTLLLLMTAKSGGWEVPAAQISDAPAMRHRSLMLDVARHFFSAEEICKVIDAMSLAKLNTLHWNLTNDQGWRIESKRYPKLNEVNPGAYYTQEEIRQVVAYAAERGIDIIPDIEMPGHVTALLSAYPELSCSGKPVKVGTQAGIFPIILCAGKESTYAFIENLLDEIIPLFPFDTFHIGADEAPKMEWEKCPHCQARAKALGLTDMHALQCDFASRVIAMLAKHGKKGIAFNDGLRGGTIDGLSTAQYWTVSNADEAIAFMEAGGEMIFSDMYEVYLDYPHSMSPLKKVYAYKPAIRGVEYSGAAVRGMEACMWTEHVPTNEDLEQKIFPRIWALAEASWTADPERDYVGFLKRLEQFVTLPELAHLTITPRNLWDPQNPERMQMTGAYMHQLQEAVSGENAEATRANANMNAEAQQLFATRFFDPEDLPMLMAAMGGGKE